jgi:hypothetical protein
MAWQDITIENCNHRFCVDDKYTSTCRICGEKKYKYENFGVKITLGLFGFDPDKFKNDVDSINYLFDNYRLDFARWFSFAEKEFDNFKKYTDEEILKLYEEQKTNLYNKRLRK